MHSKIKLMFLVRAKPGLSRDAFVRHYEDVHVPLAMRLLPFDRVLEYRRNYVLAGSDHTDTDADAIVELSFAGKDDYRAFHEVMRDPSIQSVLDADAARFTDVAYSRAYKVVEHGIA